MDRTNIITSHIKEHQDALLKISPYSVSNIATHIVSAINLGGTIYTCGNGGSAADAAHLVAELVGRFEKDRKAVKAFCLNSNMPTLTAIANDFGFKNVFSRQIESVARKPDVVIGFSTSGNSENVVEALKIAYEKGITTISFTGTHPDMLAETFSTATFKSPGVRTAIIQECHTIAIHMIASIVEQECFL
jgi:D-sedoheptulose 7-phosphate isomerase